jgi:hypothetical protein
MGAGKISLDGEPRIVSVLNGAESGAVKVTSLTSGQTVSGTLYIQLAIDASPVPLTELTFQVLDAKGAVKRFHTTHDTGAQMDLGWNTTGLDNGTYTIVIAGDAGGKAITAATLSVVVSN